jgi:hypothetical protein
MASATKARITLYNKFWTRLYTCLFHCSVDLTAAALVTFFLICVSPTIAGDSCSLSAGFSERLLIHAVGLLYPHP